MEEIEQAQFGILVEPGDITGLAEAIEQLLEDPQRMEGMGKRAREYAEQHYSWQKICQEIIDHIHPR